MGSQESRCSQEAFYSPIESHCTYLVERSKRRKRSLWRFGLRNKSKEIVGDLHNNQDIRTSEVGVSPRVTPISPVKSTSKSSSRTGGSLVVLHFVKSKIQNFFSRQSRGDRFGGITSPTAALPQLQMIPLLDINGNPSCSPLLRKGSSKKLICDGPRSENVFSRPIHEEIRNVVHPQQEVLVFPVQALTAPSGSNSNGTEESETTPSSGAGESPQTTSTDSPRNGTTTTTATKTRKRQEASSSSSQSYTASSSYGKGYAPPVAPRRGCRPPVAPPVYLDYGSANRRPPAGGGNRAEAAILNKLKNVDVIEELQYHVPGGDCCCDDNSDEFEYYSQCNDCGEMEPCGGDDKRKGKQPVTYSRRQRFNFSQNHRGSGEGEDGDGPPFAWPNSPYCTCLCCAAGLRRNPNCTCPCCLQKGNARVCNAFDEIPVGKNPEIKCICDEKDKGDSVTSGDSCDAILPKNSGVYFYDAEERRFVRQEPRTPTPLLVQDKYYSRPPTKTRTPQTAHAKDEPLRHELPGPDIMEVIRNLPLRRQGNSPCPPEPIVMPPIYGENCDMDAIMHNLQVALTGKGTMINCYKKELQPQHKSQATQNEDKKSSNPSERDVEEDEVDEEEDEEDEEAEAEEGEMQMGASGAAEENESKFRPSIRSDENLHKDSDSYD